MAKKAAPAALQTEVVNDEEWEKVLKRKGLVGEQFFVYLNNEILIFSCLELKRNFIGIIFYSVVDVYSDWSGPCTGMVSILKKLKMEIGGDALSYAMANCDRVTDLKRFQGKSEPIWMFIHEGQMVNLMFGAHCPQFVKMLMIELERVQKGEEHE
ncbi:hypothetical protein PUN28_008580 [Cardiocondyla obscurior]|uniref:Thioredoxin domain-containing protein n=1 Tax=Cardiocondyla obscurior TaxID=286306 RepID=A0AAW2G1D4_9HYME